MEGYSNLAGVRVVDSVQTNIIGDVCHLIHTQGGRGLNRQGLISGVFLRAMVDSLVKLSSQHFHDAVGVGMIMNRGAFLWVPYEKKLSKLVML